MNNGMGDIIMNDYDYDDFVWDVYGVYLDDLYEASGDFLEFAEECSVNNHFEETLLYNFKDGTEGEVSIKVQFFRDE